MSASGQFGTDDDKSLWFLAGTLVLSITGHVVTMVLLPEAMARVDKSRSVEMEFYEPPPPPPPPKEEPPPEPPKPVEKIKVKPVVKLAEVVPPKDEPPPPNDEPPPEAPKVVPIVVGISMSSTTTTGGFAVQVGNTTYGKTSDKIVDAADVKAYQAPKYAPPGGADTEPVVISQPKIEYTAEARKNDIEGPVRLKVTIDPEGRVTEVAVISGPGYGLNEVAREAIRKFRFKPATKGGEPVGYSIVFTYQFLLD
ncbi:MAG: TonB family protein [Archangium sp.]|nr:TonB family protein [Archangium sp.]